MGGWGGGGGAEDDNVLLPHVLRQIRTRTDTDTNTRPQTYCNTHTKVTDLTLTLTPTRTQNSQKRGGASFRFPQNFCDLETTICLVALVQLTVDSFWALAGVKTCPITRAVAIWFLLRFYKSFAPRFSRRHPSGISKLNHIPKRNENLYRVEISSRDMFFPGKTKKKS